MKKKILVVDDSRTALFMVTTILRNGPYDLVTAHDGQQAIGSGRSDYVTKPINTQELLARVRDHLTA